MHLRIRQHFFGRINGRRFTPSRRASTSRGLHYIVPLTLSILWCLIFRHHILYTYLCFRASKRLQISVCCVFVSVCVRLSIVCFLRCTHYPAIVPESRPEFRAARFELNVGSPSSQSVYANASVKRVKNFKRLQQIQPASLK